MRTRTSTRTTPFIRQSEHLLYAIYNFAGKFKGWSVANFLARSRQPEQVHKNFLQNRLTVQYVW